MKRICLLLLCTSTLLNAIDEQTTTVVNNAEEDAKCPCQVKPPHRNEIIEEKCPCSKPPHKDDSGAELFVQGTQGIMLCVQGGAIAQKAGDIRAGLPYIFQGLSLLTDITARSKTPEKDYQELYRFMNALDTQELDKLSKAVKIN